MGLEENREGSGAVITVAYILMQTKSCGPGCLKAG